MAIELATAYLSILPETSKIAPGVKKALGDAEKPADRTGKAIGGRLSGAVGKVMKRSAIGIGAGAGAAIGTALWKGFGRLKAIDQAKSQLRGLKLEGDEIESVMKSATKAVTGTAYGLDAAAGAAAGALGGAVSQGKELTKYLTLVADATTQSTTDFNSMALMMNKVEGAGKLTGGILRQMALNGLQVMPMLTKEYGVNAAEMQKMVSKGEISAKQFRKILQKNIGGAAQESGKTFSGAWANLQAAMGRIGAKLLGPIFEKMPKVFGSITASIDKLSPVAERVGLAIGNGLAGAFEWIGKVVPPALATIKGFFSGASEGGGQFGAALTQVRSVVAEFWGFLQIAFTRGSQAVTLVWRALGSTITSYLKSSLGNVLTVARGVLTTLQGVFKVFSSLLKGDWKGAWDGLKLIAKGFWTVLKGIISQGVNVARTALSILGKVLGAVMSAAWAVAKSAAVKGANTVVDFVKSIPGRIISGLGDLKSLLLSAGRDVVMGLVRGIKSVKDLPGKALGKIAGGLKSVVTSPLKIFSPSRVMIAVGQFISKGLSVGISRGGVGVEKAMGRISRAIEKALDGKKISKAQAKSLNKLVNQQGKALGKLAKQADKHLQRLDQMRSDRASLADSLRSSVMGEIDLGSLGGQNEFGYAQPVTFAAVQGLVSGLKSRAIAFAGKLKSLLKAGIPAGLVQEVAALGTKAGIPVADALLSGSKTEVASLAGDYKAVETAAGNIGNIVGGGMFDAGIAAQQGLLKGLTQDKGIDKAAKVLAKKLPKAVRKELGIKSPSRVFAREVGQYLPTGVIDGIDSTQGLLDARVAKMVQPPKIGSLNAPHIPLSGGASGASDDEIVELLAAILAATRANRKLVMGQRQFTLATQEALTNMGRLV